jgi:prepilin-type N-terminal cleavage/methylation domain-containing protein
MNMHQQPCLKSRKLSLIVKHSDSGFTLLEGLLTIALIGIMAAIAAPLFVQPPLRPGATQVSTLFRQLRLRAMSNTTAFRIRPDLTSVATGTSRATRLYVQASSGRECGARTTISTINPPTISGSNSVLPVTSMQGFTAGVRVTVGESPATYEVISADTVTSQMIVGGTAPGLQGNAYLGAEVELASVWRDNPQYTGLLSDQLTLAQNNSEQVSVPTEIVVNGTIVPWSLCFDARGLATLYNARTGQVINADLSLPIASCINGSNCTGNNLKGRADLTISRGGAVTGPSNITQY